MNLEAWPVHVLVAEQHHRNMVAVFDPLQVGALFIQQEVGHLDGRLYHDLAREFLHGLFFDQPQDRKRQ